MSGQDTPWLTPESVVLFYGLAAADAEKILAMGVRLEFRPGEFVYRQGAETGKFYIVVAGEVELTVDVAGGRQGVVGHIGPGGHFGETSLLTGAPNSVNVRTLTPVRLLSYSASQFSALILSHPSIHRQLSKMLAQRLRVSFGDHANSLQQDISPRTAAKILDKSYLHNGASNGGQNLFPEKHGLRSVESTIVKQLNKAIALFGERSEPLLILGESGTGRRMVAYEIHAAGPGKNGPFEEVDVRGLSAVRLEEELYGYERDGSAFSQVTTLGLLERARGGTLVLYNAECLEPSLQQQLAGVISSGSFCRLKDDVPCALSTRIILICRDDAGQENGQDRLLPELYRAVAANQFRVAPLRMHRRDIPRLVDYYLDRYNRQYGKEIPSVDEQTLAMFMNYDWPGNLAEMASVIQRAVIIGRNHAALRHQIMIGIPKPEGKWEYNLLRLRPVRTFVTSRFFPVLPRVLVGIFLVVLLGFLFFGPADGEQNLGLTLSWIIGWPLLIFAFFFLARIWCSVCGLSVPGWLAQFVVKPQRPTPQFIRRYSGWLMAGLCIFLFWVETAWNAYASPRLTGAIILSVTTGSFLFSLFFRRRVWCRYLCPLGAINALFSMPSVLELRANTHMCMNRCADYACYSGDDGEEGCPMFRHPFLVDNNRDCILCGQCIKNCKLNSVHLNLRLAPQELWNQQAPRLSDSVLVVSLAAIFFPFVVTQNYPQWPVAWAGMVDFLPTALKQPTVMTLFFVGCIGLYLACYTLLSSMLGRLTGAGWRQTASLLGYGMIPLVLGAYMAAHLEIFVDGFWLLPENVMTLLGHKMHLAPARLMTRDATGVLQIITICGALIASLYATHRIVRRLVGGAGYAQRIFWLPGSLLCLSAVVYFLFL